MLSTFVTARRGALQVMIVHSAECHHALLHLTCLHCLWSLPVSLKESWQLFVLSAPAPLNGAGADTLLVELFRACLQQYALSRCVFAEANPPAELPILQRKDENVLRRRTFLCTPVREDLIRAILPWPACYNLSLLLNAPAPLNGAVA